jgi:hypothetical protein
VALLIDRFFSFPCLSLSFLSDWAWVASFLSGVPDAANCQYWNRADRECIG